METDMFKSSLLKTLKNFKQILPIIFGVVMLVSLVLTFVPASFYAKVFTDSDWIDPLVGAFVGSVSTGNPVVSYILGGELLSQGVSLIAVTAFILSWVTVGIIQLPAESLMLGKRFALARNAFSFITSLIVAYLTVLTLSFL